MAVDILNDIRSYLADRYAQHGSKPDCLVLTQPEYRQLESILREHCTKEAEEPCDGMQVDGVAIQMLGESSSEFVKGLLFAEGEAEKARDEGISALLGPLQPGPPTYWRQRWMGVDDEP